MVAQFAKNGNDNRHVERQVPDAHYHVAALERWVERSAYDGTAVVARAGVVAYERIKQVSCARSQGCKADVGQRVTGTTGAPRAPP